MDELPDGTTVACPACSATSGWRGTLLRFLLALGLCLGAGGLGSLAMDEASMAWYRSLETVSLQPPGGVIGAVWTVLYALMAVSLTLLWNAPAGGARRRAVVLFLLQLALNAAWSWLFFRAQSIPLGLLGEALLLAALLAAMRQAWRVRTWAGILFLPYAAWVVFATLLTLRLWQANAGG